MSRIRAIAVLALALAMGVPLLSAVESPPAAAAPPTPPRLIVGMNAVTPAFEAHADPRPQTWDASANGTPTVRGVAATWAGGRFQVSVGSNTASPVHPGLSAAPQLGQDNPDTELGGYAQLDDTSYASFDGRADFVDLAADEQGNLTRFDLVFSYTEQRAVGAVFGEIRMNEPEQLATLSPTAQHLVWPKVGLEDDPVLATDSFRNTSGAPLPLGPAKVVGALRDYRLRDDSCSGHVLPAGGSCSITVAYRPTRGGPRLATLEVPTPTDALAVHLSSSAMLGRSSLSTQGLEYVDYGKKWSFSPIVVYSHGSYGHHEDPDRGYTFVPDELSPQIKASPRSDFTLQLTKKHGTIKRGTHKTELFAREYGLDYHRNTQYCDSLGGTLKVRHFVVDAEGQPTWIDVDFAQTCTRAHIEPVELQKGTIHGRLRYQDRKDTSAPRRPSKLRLEGGQLRWKRSSNKDLATTIVRADLGERFDPTRGIAVSDGRRQSAALPRLQPGQTYTVAAFSVDKTGNVSRPTTLRVTT
ncbi:hypothetical protein [Microlunatus antarcticus]|uniref:Fibronectin type-III domain-containing protein n=1 Tax=Microlunatus antarcticus TaxID=53388 RepID=A0A7W5JVQ2_9ACTN|nr:hypothetical protein [Microlunatus antarcticus]MBB3327222.1 hypothetical protein [Microlunatus antarcticus]